jgi:glyceraldehyde 3-phosphate dehydrogenase
MAVKIGINGFGRIGRLVYRAMVHDPEIEVVAANDLTNAKTLAYLLKFDSVHGRYPGDVRVESDNVLVDGNRLKVLNIPEPVNLPWGDLGVPR